MARTYLRDLTDWKLSDPHQDVRGWTLRTSDGRALGRIQHMVANTETQHVESVLLEDGTEYPVERLRIGKEDVFLSPAGTSARSMDMNTHTGIHDFTDSRKEIRIPIVEEKVDIGKRTVDKGGARIHTKMKERPVEETVNLRETKVKVDRHPTDRPASMQDFERASGTMEIRETAEEPVVEKSARVKEEVVIKKDVRNHPETIRETEKRTDLEVEPLQGEHSRKGDRLHRR